MHNTCHPYGLCINKSTHRHARANTYTGTDGYQPTGFMSGDTEQLTWFCMWARHIQGHVLHFLQHFRLCNWKYYIQKPNADQWAEALQATLKVTRIENVASSPFAPNLGPAGRAKRDTDHVGSPKRLHLICLPCKLCACSLTDRLIHRVAMIR